MYRRLFTLRFLHKTKDAGQHGIVSNGRDLRSDGSGFEDAPTDERVFLPPVHGHAFAADDGLIHMCLTPKDLTVYRHLFATADQDQVTHFQLGVLQWENDLLVLVVECDHVGHHLLRFQQILQCPLGGCQGKIFQVVTEEYKCDDGGSGFVEHVFFA